MNTTNATKVFKFYSDSGHGWLAVKRQLLADLAILDKVTRYSYQRGQTVYLEEDCDVSTFFLAFEAKYGVRPTTKEGGYTNGSSPIRSYEGFSL